MAWPVGEVGGRARERVIAARVADVLDERDREAGVNEVGREAAVAPGRTAVAVRDDDERKRVTDGGRIERELDRVRTERLRACERVGRIQEVHRKIGALYGIVEVSARQPSCMARL